MSMSLSQFYRAALVLLLAAFTYVHSLQRKSVNNHQDNQQDLTDHTGKEHHHTVAGHTLVSYQRDHPQKTAGFSDKKTMLDGTKKAHNKIDGFVSPAGTTDVLEQSPYKGHSKKQFNKIETQQHATRSASRQGTKTDSNFTASTSRQGSNTASNSTTSASGQGPNTGSNSTASISRHGPNMGSNFTSTSRQGPNTDSNFTASTSRQGPNTDSNSTASTSKQGPTTGSNSTTSISRQGPNTGSNSTASVSSDSIKSQSLHVPDDLHLHLEERDNHLWSKSSTHTEAYSDATSNRYSKDSSTHSGCKTCHMRQVDKHNRILSFKQQILNTLQMRSLPNTTGVPIPKVPALVHLYDMDATMMSDSPPGRTEAYTTHPRHVEYDEDFIIKTERVFTPGKPAPIGVQLNASDTVYFPPSVQLFTSKIKATHLWIYIKKGENPSTLITVERILPESLTAQRIVTKKIFLQKLTNDKAFGWKRVDMRDTMRHWIRHPMSNLGLLMRADDNTGGNLIVVPPSADSDKGYEPWLDSRVIEPRSNSRRRRSESLLCVENSTDSRCCRHPLLVGFAEFGWDWIIAPTHVKADYCTGECRMTMQDNTPYSWVNQQTSGSNSCCTPTKLSPLPLLYFDESMNIVYQILQNMKVDKCGCA